MIHSESEHDAVGAQTAGTNLLLGALPRDVMLVKTGMMGRLYQGGEGWLGRKDPRHRIHL